VGDARASDDLAESEMTPKTHKSFVVYTVLVGGYDQVLQPLVIDERFDYVMFTDVEGGEGNLGVWQVRKFDYFNEDKTRMSRYPKMHPEELLPGYEASLYIDANIQITGEWVYERFIALYEQRVEWGGRWLCDSLYDHVYFVLLDGFESKLRCIAWSQQLRKEGFPKKFLVYENNVIFRLNSKNVLDANRLWWDYYTKYSRRDQCTLPYVLWRLSELHTDFFVPKGQNTWDNGLSIVGHGKGSNKIRFPFHSYPGYVQLRFMNTYLGWERRLNDMFYTLSFGNRNVAVSVITLVSWFIFLFYAPVVYYKKYFRNR